MPAKPAWAASLPRIIKELRAQPELIDRASLEAILGTGRRRTQQIMASCVLRRVGGTALAGREELIDRLRQLADGQEPEGADRETERRRRLAVSISQWERERKERPQLWVEAPARMRNQRLRDLPEGVSFGKGRITVQFTRPNEGLEALLALAMAIGNDFEEFLQEVS